MNSKPEVLVIGGGVIGVAIADALARAGTDVVVIDRDQPGHGCSFGNAGWITPCFATPLPRPGLVLKAARWMLDRRSPLRVPLRPDPALVAWLIRFLWHTRRAQFVTGTKALVELSRYSLAAYQELAEQAGPELDFHRRGLLQVGLTPEGVRGILADLKVLATLGVNGTPLDEVGVRELEPAIAGPVAGGVYFPDEAHLEPLNAVRAMAERAERAGAQIVPFTEVGRIRTNGRLITGVRTNRGWFEPEIVVLAAGTWTRNLAAQVGLRLPLYGGKGYSMMLDRSATTLRTPVMIVEKKVAITPHSGRVRTAGTLELVRDDPSISPQRAESIREATFELLGLPHDTPVQNVWSGLRPCTPDGIPAIGRSERIRNLIVAAGHQMLGMQTAPATGRLVADLVLERTPTFDPAPFSLARYE